MFRPAADLNLWRVATLAFAWLAVLLSALAARDSASSREVSDQAQAPVVAASRTEAAPADAASLAPAASAIAIDFARELHATLESDRLRLLISRRLPMILGVRDVWVVARFGTRQQMIVPSSPDGQALGLIGDEARQWTTYPLRADGRTVGVLGAAPPPGGFSDHDHRLFKLVASLVAQALATADAFEAMREASLVDPLTGCSTRAEGLRRLEAEVRRAQRGGRAVAVLMLDLDHFKSINDRFGHKTGDAALAAVGETLLTTLRASDVRCRWGGEEFLLVLPDSSVDRAHRAAENLRQRIANTPVGAGDQVVNITASIGVALSESGETDIQQLIGRADTGLYEAKRLGRNRVSLVSRGRSTATSGHTAPAPPPSPSTPFEGQSVGHAIGQSIEQSMGPTMGLSGGDAPNGRMEPWNGVERRDGQRRDRRRVPSPGRRRTDAVVALPRSDRKY